MQIIKSFYFEKQAKKNKTNKKMSMRKSLVIGGSIVLIAILLSVLTFFMSLGKSVFLLKILNFLHLVCTLHSQKKCFFFVRIQIHYRKSVKSFTFSRKNHDLFLKKEQFFSNKEHF
jgi:hypothetical protein